MIEPMKEMAGFIVMVFPLAQFVAMFNWSNMGKFMAVGLTDLLESSGMNGVPAFVGLALLSAFLCMFIASGSAIWSILAPIFVPMFMLLGFHPAFAQILFRIADSSVLPLAPVSPFVPLFLGFLQRYRPDARLGTYYSLVLPYPLIFLAVWLLLLVGWYLVGLPIGPASIRGCLNPPMRGDGRLSLTRYLHFELTGRFPGSGEYAEKRAIPPLKQQRHTVNNQTAEDQYDYASQYILHSSTSELLTAPRRRGSTFPSAHSGAEDRRRQLKSSKTLSGNPPGSIQNKSSWRSQNTSTADSPPCYLAMRFYLLGV